jgi:hypothetical protein
VTGKLLFYNLTGQCSFGCGTPSTSECIGQIAGTDVVEGADVYSCDFECDSNRDSIILRTYVQTCSAVTGTCDEENERQINKTSGQSVTLIKDQDDMFLRFSLKMKDDRTGKEEDITIDPNEIKATLLINGVLYEPVKGQSNPVKGLPESGWYLKMFDKELGTYNLKLEINHPSLIDMSNQFPVHVSKLQVAQIDLSNEEGGSRSTCFYRQASGTHSCGLETTWVKVSSKDQETQEPLTTGTAVCHYSDRGIDYSITLQLDEWEQIDVSSMSVGMKNLRCEVEVQNYVTAEPKSQFLVRGIITNAAVEMPPELTPGTAVSFNIRNVIDEQGVLITSPQVAWFISNYPEEGQITQFCESLTCNQGLPADVSTGNQTLTLSVKKSLPQVGEIYDMLIQNFEVDIKEAVKYSLSIAPKSRVVSKSGGEATFIASVSNQGNQPIDVSMTLIPTPQLSNWTDFTTTTKTIQVGRRLDQQIKFTVPPVQEGNYTFNITALEASRGIKRTIEGTIRAVTPQIYEVSITPLQDLNFTLAANKTKEIDIIISNDGNMDDSYTLSLLGAGSRIASLNVSEIPIKAGELDYIQLSILGEVGIHEFDICARSQTDTTVENCQPVNVRVIQERVELIVPEKLEIIQGENSTLTIELKGYGQALILLNGDSLLTSWLPWISQEVTIPSTVQLQFLPERKGEYNLTIDLVLSSGKTHTREISIIVTPTELELQITSEISDMQILLNSIDRRMNQLETQGVKAILTESLVTEIEKKRAQIQDLIDKGDYESAKVLVAELKNLIEQAEEYSKVSTSVALRPTGPNPIVLFLGFISILLGIVGIYFFLIRPHPKLPLKPTTTRQLPLSGATKQLPTVSRFRARKYYPQYLRKQ